MVTKRHKSLRISTVKSAYSKQKVYFDHFILSKHQSSFSKGSFSFQCMYNRVSKKGHRFIFQYSIKASDFEYLETHLLVFVVKQCPQMSFFYTVSRINHVSVSVQQSDTENVSLYHYYVMACIKATKTPS